MQTIDFSPLFRSVIGFDRVAQLLDSVQRTEAPGYPPYNVEKIGDDAYRISMAVAGFRREDLELKAEGELLTVSGRAPADEGERQYLHRGIAGRSFVRRFTVAEHVRVTGARLENGLLHIDLAREIPDAMKPRVIPIGDESANPRQIADAA